MVGKKVGKKHSNKMSSWGNAPSGRNVPPVAGQGLRHELLQEDGVKPEPTSGMAPSHTAAQMGGLAPNTTKTWLRMIDLRVSDVGHYGSHYEFKPSRILTFVLLQGCCGVCLTTLASYYYHQCDIISAFLLAAGLTWTVSGLCAFVSWRLLNGMAAGREFRVEDHPSSCWRGQGCRRVTLGLLFVIGSCCQLFGASLTLDCTVYLYEVWTSTDGAVMVGDQICNKHQQIVEGLLAPAGMSLLSAFLSVLFFFRWIDLELRNCGLNTYMAICCKSQRPLFHSSHTPSQKDSDHLCRRRWLVVGPKTSSK